ncbi:hypothetical protein KSU1_C1359 [Candidatus Jettenia caeni]|uniref:Uncharacterized protein n=1 Tax=Candidatus Jettenia caeni TaxID=247490 RepID=I3IML0_9BACT|nr:hypothetical protein KSU1_C1359 [Candidatus Jettenia caeni]
MFQIPGCAGFPIKSIIFSSYLLSMIICNFIIKILSWQWDNTSYDITYSVNSNLDGNIPSFSA